MGVQSTLGSHKVLHDPIKYFIIRQNAPRVLTRSQPLRVSRPHIEVPLPKGRRIIVEPCYKSLVSLITLGSIHDSAGAMVLWSSFPSLYTLRWLSGLDTHGEIDPEGQDLSLVLYLEHNVLSCRFEST